VHHETEDAHLSGAALVQFNSALLELFGFAELVPSKVNVSVSEITGEGVFASGVLHDSHFHEEDKGNDLGQTSLGHGGKSGETVGDISKGGSVRGDETGEASSTGSGEVSDHGHHGDAAVLDFRVTKTVEFFLVTIGHEAHGVPETKGSLGSKFLLEGIQGSRGDLLGGRSKGGGSGEKGGKNGRLHGGNGFVEMQEKEGQPLLRGFIFCTSARIFEFNEAREQAFFYSWSHRSP